MEKELEINEKTRSIYHNQHERVANDAVAMERFLNMVQEEYFGLPENFFHGKKILDAGCGDTAKLLIRFYQFGARDIVGLDLGEEFIPVAKKSLQRNNVPDENIKLVSGNIVSLPFEDESFDFVCCHGVLLHLANKEQVKTAFQELARVTKKGGYLYTVYGLYGGLFEYIYPQIRNYYKENDEFKNIVDNIAPENFLELIRFSQKESLKHGIDINLDEEKIKSLFDTDLCVTIQNIIQAPVRLSIAPAEIDNMYRSSGFSGLRKLKRFVKRSNLRKYFAPFHYNSDHVLSKILYGTGNLEYIGRKD